MPVRIRPTLAEYFKDYEVLSEALKANLATLHPNSPQLTAEIEVVIKDLTVILDYIRTMYKTSTQNYNSGTSNNLIK